MPSSTTRPADERTEPRAETAVWSGLLAVATEPLRLGVVDRGFGKVLFRVLPVLLGALVATHRVGELGGALLGLGCATMRARCAAVCAVTEVHGIPRGLRCSSGVLPRGRLLLQLDDPLLELLRSFARPPRAFLRAQGLITLTLSGHDRNYPDTAALTRQMAAPRRLQERRRGDVAALQVRL